MNEWGWNPATVSIVVSASVSLLTLATLLYVAKAANAARKATEIATKDFDLRSRPWVGLSNVEWEEEILIGIKDAPLFYVLVALEHHNVGSIPANKLVVSWEVFPVPGQNLGDVDTSPIKCECLSLGEIFPNEPGVTRIQGQWGKPRFGEWVKHHAKLQISGAFDYQAGDHRYRTEFEGQVMVGTNGRPRVCSWSNVSAT